MDKSKKTESEPERTDQVDDQDDVSDFLGESIDDILNKAAESAEKEMAAALGEVDGDGDTGGGTCGDIDSVKQELEASKDRYLRLMAEFDNYKRRSAKEYERLVAGANEKLILEMVDVRENFERALKAGEQGGEAGAFFDGMKMIFAKFEEVLSANGLGVFAEVGEAFDPMIHDAMMNQPHAEIPVDHIVQIFERGYRLKDRIIKHARVIVSSGAEG